MLMDVAARRLVVRLIGPYFDWEGWFAGLEHLGLAVPDRRIQDGGGGTLLPAADGECHGFDLVGQDFPTCGGGANVGLESKSPNL